MKNDQQHPDSHHAIENNIYNYILVFFVCAFIGWIWEVALFFVRTGSFINRGVLHGPWLPIYGCGGLGIALFLQRFKKHPLIVFILSVIGCGTLEYFTGWYLETFKHLKWWDYSAEFMNLHGRICFGSLLAFGVCGLVVTYLIYPILIKLFGQTHHQLKKAICIVLMVTFFADFIYSSDVPNTGYGITDQIIKVETTTPSNIT